MNLKIKNGLDKVRSLQIFQVIRYGGVILTNILLAKSVLSLTEIGVFETLIFLSSMVSFFWVSGLLRGLLPTYPDLSEKEKKIFLFNVFLLFCLVSVIVSSLFFLLEKPITVLLTEHDSLPYFRLLGLYLLINTPTYLVEYLYLLTDQPKKMIGFGVFAFGGYILAVMVPLWVGYTLEESFYCLIGLAVLKFLWLLVILINRTIWSFNPGILQGYLLLSFPLIMNMIVAGGAEYIDGVIVHRFFDKDTFAIFRYGAREFPLALALSTAFSAALIPEITKNLEKGMAEIKTRSRRLMHLLYPISIVLMLSSPFLFPVVFNPEFADSAIIFNIYLLVLICRLLFPQTIIIGLKKTDIILWVSIFELAVNVILSLIFVQIWGLPGIALATLIAFAIDKIVLVVYNKVKFDIPVKKYLDFRLYGIYSIFLIASFLVALNFFD
ncbi:MAG: polysaccharide biosynthesis C-terminal domain-containing protein [Bacteroidota bacterium]